MVKVVKAQYQCNACSLHWTQHWKDYAEDEPCPRCEVMIEAHEVTDVRIDIHVQYQREKEDGK